MNKIREHVDVESIPETIEPIEPVVEKKASAPAKPSALNTWIAQNMSKESAINLMPFLFF